MKLSQHCLSALPLAGLAYAATGQAVPALVAGASSVLIDCDHVTDYVLCNRGWGGMKHFFASCEEGKLHRLFLILHAWEWQLAIWLLIAMGTAPAWMVGLGLGMAGHLVLDQIGNRHIVRPTFYWLCVRAKNRFNGNALYQVPPGTLTAFRGS